MIAGPGPAPGDRPLEAGEEVARATDAILRAARDGDPDALADAVRRRAIAVERLCALLERRADRSEAAAEIDGLNAQARQAEEALQALMSTTRDAAASLRREATALRSYAANSPEATGLDRAG